MGLLPARGDIRYLGAPRRRADGRAARRARAHPRAGAARAVRGDERRRQPRARRVPARRAAASAAGARTLDEVYQRFPRLRERRDQLAGTLSGGERQMLAMGRALMGKPRLLMLDEPSLGLAPLIVREIFSIIVGAARDRRVDPAGRAERARGAAGLRLRLRARDRRARARRPERRARRESARRGDLSRARRGRATRPARCSAGHRACRRRS